MEQSVLVHGGDDGKSLLKAHIPLDTTSRPHRNDQPHFLSGSRDYRHRHIRQASQSLWQLVISISQPASTRSTSGRPRPTLGLDTTALEEFSTRTFLVVSHGGVTEKIKQSSKPARGNGEEGRRKTESDHLNGDTLLQNLTIHSADVLAWLSSLHHIARLLTFSSSPIHQLLLHAGHVCGAKYSSLHPIFCN